LLFAIAVPVSVRAATPLDPQHGVIMPLAATQSLISKGAIENCSREGVDGVTAAWLPEKDDVAELEARLPDAIAAEVSQRGPAFAQEPDFARQYFGIVVGGRKLIYVYAFPVSMIPSRIGARVFDWTQQTFGVCDGGPSIFSFLYDPETREFSAFAFNGNA
jgi:hypothetical protein